MRRGLKAVIIAAVALITVGLALTIFSAIFYGSSVFNYITTARTGGQSERITVTMSASELQSLRLKITNAQITVTQSKDGNASITYNYYADENFMQTNTAGTLAVEQQGNVFFGLFDWFQNRDHQVEIALPAECTARVSISLVNGSINGENFAAGDLVISQTNGSISLSDVKSADSIAVDTVNVGIAVADCTAADEIRCKSVNGKIENGALTAKQVYCETVNGRISVDKAEADSITCTTVNGSMEVGIRGSEDDYSMSFSSVNGSLTVDNENLGKSANIRGGSKSAKFSSVNGSATVHFLP